MLVVVDANELFSLLIKESKESKEILVSKKLQLIAPEFLLIEFSNNKDEILSKTHRTEEEFLEILSVIEDRVKFIAEEEFKEFIPEASEILKGHTKDIPYFALALKFKCPIWSEEKLLKKQLFVKVLDTFELFNLIKE